MPCPCSPCSSFLRRVECWFGRRLAGESGARTRGGIPGHLENPLGTAPAIGGGLELVRAGGAAGRPTLDAAKVVEVMLDIGTAAATRSHLGLLGDELAPG